MKSFGKQLDVQAVDYFEPQRVGDVYRFGSTLVVLYRAKFGAGKIMRVGMVIWPEVSEGMAMLSIVDHVPDRRIGRSFALAAKAYGLAAMGYWELAKALTPVDARGAYCHSRAGASWYRRFESSMRWRSLFERWAAGQ